MKKIFFLSFISLAFAFASCSKSDDTDDSDVVYGADFTPLKDLKDLDSNVWLYKGLKLGSRKFGYVAQSNCLSNNNLVFYKGSDEITPSFMYTSKKMIDSHCELDFTSSIRVDLVTDEGLWTLKEASINDSKNNLRKQQSDFASNNSSTTNSFEAKESDLSKYRKLDIGYQSGMLRIGEKISDYDGNEKIYFYFKKP